MSSKHSEDIISSIVPSGGMCLKLRYTGRYIKVSFEPSGISGYDEEGRTVIDAATDLNVSIRSHCGGKGRCGKYRVVVNPAENLLSVTDAEGKLLNVGQLETGYRLACQATVLGAITVSIPPEGLEDKETYGKLGVSRSYCVNFFAGTLYRISTSQEAHKWKHRN